MIVKNILRCLRRFFRAQEAVSALEYAVLVGVIIAGIGGALLAFSGNITTALNAIGNQVATQTGPTMPTPPNTP